MRYTPMALAPSSSPVSTTAAPARFYAGPMVLMTTLFFLFGAVTNFNGVLMPYLKEVCHLSDFESSLVPSAFFAAYFLMSLPAGWVLNRIGYQRGIVLGLLVMAAGALVFVPAANAQAFSLFLLGLSLLGAGVTLLQVAANPYVSVLGPAREAASRVSIVGVANGLGGTLSPLVGGLLLFGSSELLKKQLSALPESQRLMQEAALVKSPYMGLAGFLAALAILFFMVRLPKLESIPADEEASQADEALLVGRKSALDFRHLVLGVGAIFLYVGVEVGLGDFLIRYGQSQHIADLSPFTQLLVQKLNAVTNFGLLVIGQSPLPIDTTHGFTAAVGAVMVASYWFGLMVGRIVGIPLLRRFPDRPMLVGVCAAGAFLVLASIFTHGETALWLIVLCGLCNSIMWPVIFPLAIKGLGPFTKQGSSYLIMGIVGGAVISLLMGWLATHGGGLRVAFVVPALCYLYLLFYAMSGYRVR
jgi:FHS family L-fucose permease-like MFS transporter